MTAPPTIRARVSMFAAIVLATLALGSGCSAEPAPDATPTTPPARSSEPATDAVPAAGGGAYVALGDSYAAGMGGGEYLDSCLTSPNGYAATLASDAGAREAELRGCAGATTDDVIASQLGALDEGTGTVTLTVGANDLGVRALGEACFSGTPEVCFATVETGLERLGELSVDLVTLFDAVRAAAPRATVYVTGYPLLVEEPRDDAEAAVNDGMVLLNDVIEGAVAAAGGDVVFVEVESAFVGHRIGGADPWLIAPPDGEAFHPNPAGYAAYAEAIRAAG
jgi:lysophospholipase L1-like esterase